jgi:electron transport complex protein RnfG
MIRSIFYLVLAAVLATVIIVVAEQSTRAQRELNNARYATRMLSEVLPAGDYDQPPGLQVFNLKDEELLGSKTPLPAYPVYRDGQTVAVILSVIATDGYVGPIPLLVGISRDGQILGVRAAGHRETPGLGDKIEIQKSDWIRQFEQRTLETTANWGLKRDGGDFDHISGATITSRAVTQAVKRALDYFAINRDRLIEPPKR